MVCQIHPSVSSAYKALEKQVGVSRVSLYNKLNGIEAEVSQALVRYSVESLAPVVEQLGWPTAAQLPGYQLKILDGNSLAASEHRLEVTRRVEGGPLPGKSLVILNGESMLVEDYFPEEDAYTQERALLTAVLEKVQPRQLWLGDRNFCTRGFLGGITQKQGSFVIRQHKQMPYQALEELKWVGNSPTGEVFEQEIQVELKTGSERWRRVVVKLSQPTREGDKEVAVLTNLPLSDAGGLKVADLYLQRWTIEGLFQILTDCFACEISTLGYPQAALFAFAVALVSYNLLAVIKAALGSVHGHGKVQAGLSNYYLVEEIQGIYRGMSIALPAQQ